ncbi:MAG: hypothetical protein J6K17_08625 [Oscillospiraceae bacterium]|nr:hypothetical protein [Oscillospiraceae bacterium]
MNYKNDSDTHDINLNIHYSIPNELWNKVIDVFRSMPYWVEDEINKDCLFWYDEEDCVELYCSVEPGGIQISGLMMYEIWRKWYPKLKNKLTEALGYEIGEPEEGYSFKYWQ